MADVTAGLFFVHPGLSFCTDDGRLLECCAPSSKVANCAFGKVEERELCSTTDCTYNCGGAIFTL